MAQLDHSFPRAGVALPALPALPYIACNPQQAEAEGPFWCGAIGSGAAAVLELVPRIDLLAQRAAQLPVRASLTRPVVGQYLSMVKTLAAAWQLHSRPALLASMEGLLHFGASVGQSFALEAVSGRCADNGRAALRVADALQRRLAAPLAAFDALGADFASYLAQMARVSGELDADTRLVTQRLQADHVHVFLLSQQATALQAKLEHANLREHAGSLAGPPGQALQQERALNACALEGVQRQLEQLRAEQAATLGEADYLQGLMPSVAPYLAAVDRLGAGIDAILAGARVLGARLANLKQSLGEAAPAAGPALQLAAARPHWQALAAAAASLK